MVVYNNFFLKNKQYAFAVTTNSFFISETDESL